MLQQLDSNESILLMYLADELPPAEHAEVEQMLARDATLLAELQRLRAAHEMIAGKLARLDAAHPAAASEAAHARQVGRLVRQWHARRLEMPKTDPTQPAELRFPYWSYPLAAAAAVTLAFVTWWYKVAEPNQLPPGAGGGVAALIDREDRPLETIDLYEGEPVQFASLTSFDDVRGLSELELELQQLESLREFMK